MAQSQGEHYLTVFPKLSNYPFPDDLMNGRWNKKVLLQLHLGLKSAVDSRLLDVVEVYGIQEKLFNDVNSLRFTNQALSEHAVAIKSVHVVIDEAQYQRVVQKHSRNESDHNAYNPLKPLQLFDVGVCQARWLMQRSTDRKSGNVTEEYILMLRPYATVVNRWNEMRLSL